MTTSSEVIMSSLTVPIPEAAAAELAGLAQAEGTTPERLVAAVVARYLEDREDIADALAALYDGEEPIRREEVKRGLSL
jgi:hypothetical protein